MWDIVTNPQTRTVNAVKNVQEDIDEVNDLDKRLRE